MFNLDINTFVDPNGDPLYYSVLGVPSWMNFTSDNLTFSGIAKTVSEYNITVIASDDWGTSANVTFEVYTGSVSYAPPEVGTLLQD